MAMFLKKVMVFSLMFLAGFVCDAKDWPFKLDTDNIMKIEEELVKGYSPNAENVLGQTALRELAKKGPTVFSAYSGNLSLIEKAKLFVSYGANVNAVDHDGWTALHFAAQSNNYEMAQILIANGAYLNKQNNDGDTPLHVAVKALNSERVLTVLLEAGALCRASAQPDSSNDCYELSIPTWRDAIARKSITLCKSCET